MLCDHRVYSDKVMMKTLVVLVKTMPLEHMRCVVVANEGLTSS